MVLWITVGHRFAEPARVNAAEAERSKNSALAHTIGLTLLRKVHMTEQKGVYWMDTVGCITDQAVSPSLSRP